MGVMPVSEGGRLQRTIPLNFVHAATVVFFFFIPSLFLSPAPLAHILHYD